MTYLEWVGFYASMSMSTKGICTYYLSIQLTNNHSAFQYFIVTQVLFASGPNTLLANDGWSLREVVYMHCIGCSYGDGIDSNESALRELS